MYNLGYNWRAQSGALNMNWGCLSILVSSYDIIIDAPKASIIFVQRNLKVIMVVGATVIAIIGLSVGLYFRFKKIDNKAHQKVGNADLLGGKETIEQLLEDPKFLQMVQQKVNSEDELSEVLEEKEEIIIMLGSLSEEGCEQIVKKKLITDEKLTKLQSVWKL